MIIRPVLRLSSRLVITYIMLVLATLLVVTGLVVLLTRDHLATELDRQLIAAVDMFQKGPASDISDPSELAPKTRRWLRVTAFPGDQEVLVRTPDGAVLSSTSAMDLYADARARALLRGTESRWWELASRDGLVRGVSVPIHHDGRQVATMVSAAYKTRIGSLLSSLVTRIGLAAAIGLVFAAGLGLAVIRRALRPLEKMAADVDAIQQTGNLTGRVSPPGPMDEVGHLAAAFDRMLEKLQGTFDRQRQFISDASHELRTPLTVVRGQLELLNDRVHDAQQRRSVSLAVEELDRMRRIVEDLLLLARLDEGLAVKREPVEVELVLREALLRGMLLERRPSTVDVQSGLFAWGDVDRLLQVLTNLVTNAVQHTDERAAIRLSARRAGDRVVIDVSNTGHEIPEEDLPRLFERMYRGSRARASSPAGAGLGLAIAASLVKAMGGSIQATSGSNGTTFTVSLASADDPRPMPADVQQPGEFARSGVPAAR